MKKYRKTVLLAMVAVLLAAQPAWAAGAGGGFRAYEQESGTSSGGSSVIVAGPKQHMEGPGYMLDAGDDTPGEVWQDNGPEPAGGDLGGQAQAGQETGAGQQAPAVVIVAGQGQSGMASGQQAEGAAEQAEAGQQATAEEAGQQEAAQQAAAEEAAQQAAAEEAAQQAAAEEAARQAAAEEAARQAAAEEAARQAAAAGQGSSGRYIDPSRPMVALTYDDGPQTSVGNRIMDCLAQYGGKATFFMVGERVPSHAAEVRRMVNEGHEVANHSMNHKYLQKLGAAEIQSQVDQCNNIIESVCGVRPRVMRLPGGNYNDTVKANTHMPMIQWNIDTLDWKTRNADKTVNSVLSKVKDGDIILMHELYSQTGDASMRIIPELVNRGFQLVTVSEMAAAKGYNLQAGKLYSSFK